MVLVLVVWGWGLGDEGEVGEEGEGGGVGDVGGEALEAAGGGAGGVGVAQDGVGGAEEGLELAVDFGVVEVGVAHAAYEYAEGCDDVGGQWLVGAVGVDGALQARDEGVDDVVDAAAVAGKFDDAHIFGADVIDDGGKVLSDRDVDVAAAAAAAWHVAPAEPGEGSVDDAYEVALAEVDFVGGVAGQAVAVGAGDDDEGLHICL